MERVAERRRKGSEAVDHPDVGHGVECLQLRGGQPAAPFHYLISEQAKSLVALQELQHEVGALLEFRDLVMETFPNLRTKMAQQTATNSTPTTMTGHHHHLHLSNIPVSVRPGGEWTPGARMRKKPGKDTVTVQDSGFSTEASSKETHSASSTSAAAPCPSSSSAADDVEDELWNLLDVIQRKGTRLKEEVEALQGTIRERQTTPEDDLREGNFERVLFRASADDVVHLRNERDLLLDRLAEMEAEVMAGRIRTTRLQEEMENLLVAKQDLEDQLRAIASQRGEINSRIHDLHVQFVAKGGANGDDRSKTTSVKDSRGVVRAGDLDRAVGDRLPKVGVPDRAKIAAILKEQNMLVLKKHLLVTTVQNQVLRQKLDNVGGSELDLRQKLDKVREENDDLRFQLADRTIELEGTRARARLLEDLHKPTGGGSPDVVPDSAPSFVRTEITTESMKAMLPIHIQMDHSSSTESAHDQAESNHRSKDGSAGSKRRPSKIPLKSYTPPKQAAATGGKHSPAPRSRSGDSPHRSHSAQHSWRNNRSDNSMGKGSLPKSRNGSLVSAKDASGKRSFEAKKPPPAAAKWPPPRHHPPQQQQQQQKDEKDPNFAWAKEKSPFRWIPSSYNGAEYPDSLTDPPTPATGGDAATWRSRAEFFDSIDSNDTFSSCCRSNGEDLAECDSLEAMPSDLNCGVVIVT